MWSAGSGEGFVTGRKFDHHEDTQALRSLMGMYNVAVVCRGVVKGSYVRNILLPNPEARSDSLLRTVCSAPYYHSSPEFRLFCM
jgi:hypothetical protein